MHRFGSKNRTFFFLYQDKHDIILDDWHPSGEYAEAGQAAPRAEFTTERAGSNEIDCINAINVERANNGLPAPVQNQLIIDAARGHSTDMATNDFPIIGAPTAPVLTRE